MRSSSKKLHGFLTRKTRIVLAILLLGVLFIAMSFLFWPSVIKEDQSNRCIWKNGTPAGGTDVANHNIYYLVPGIFVGGYMQQAEKDSKCTWDDGPFQINLFAMLDRSRVSYKDKDIPITFDYLRSWTVEKFHDTAIKDRLYYSLSINNPNDQLNDKTKTRIKVSIMTSDKSEEKQEKSVGTVCKTKHGEWEKYCTYIENDAMELGYLYYWKNLGSWKGRLKLPEGSNQKTIVQINVSDVSYRDEIIKIGRSIRLAN